MSALREIATHAREAWPRECCGLLIGTAGAIETVHRARNLDESPTRYLVHPEDHFAAIRLARARALTVVGAYHSHPAGHPVPSPTDLAEAHEGTFVHLVAGVRRTRRASWYRGRRGTIRSTPCSVSRRDGLVPASHPAVPRRERSRRRPRRAPAPPRMVEVLGQWLAAWRLVDGNFVPVPLVRLP
jgi:proteasome lid subunit RPN8/RPN11